MIALTLEDNKRRIVNLPVLPEEIRVVSDGDEEDYTIQGMDYSVVVPTTPGTRELEVESFFPVEGHRFAGNELHEPKYYIDLLTEWRAKRTLVHVVYAGRNYGFSYHMAVMDFEVWEAYGDGDVNYRFTLKESIDLTPKRIKIKPPAPTVKPADKPKQQVVKKDAPARQDTSNRPVEYRLVKGDTLWGLAVRYTKQGKRYPEIQKLNGIKDNQLRRLPIGLKVKIPPAWTAKK